MAGAGAAAAVEEDFVADYTLTPGTRLVPWEKCDGILKGMVVGNQNRAENSPAILDKLKEHPLPRGVFLSRGWLMASDVAREPLMPVYLGGTEGEHIRARDLYDHIFLARLAHQAQWLLRLLQRYDLNHRRAVRSLGPRAPAFEFASDPDPPPARTRGRPPANAPKPPVTPVDRFCLFRFTVDVDVSIPLDMGVMGDGELWRAGDDAVDVREDAERLDARGRFVAASFAPPAQIQTVMDVCRMATYVMRACVQDVDPGDADRVWDTVAVSTEATTDVGASGVSFVRFTWPKITCESVEEYGALYRAFVFRFRERILSVAGAETGDGELDAVASLFVEDRHDDDPDDDDYRPSPGAGVPGVTFSAALLGSDESLAAPDDDGGDAGVTRVVDLHPLTTSATLESLHTDPSCSIPRVTPSPGVKVRFVAEAVCTSLSWREPGGFQWWYPRDSVLVPAAVLQFTGTGHVKELGCHRYRRGDISLIGRLLHRCVREDDDAVPSAPPDLAAEVKSPLAYSVLDWLAAFAVLPPRTDVPLEGDKGVSGALADARLGRVVRFVPGSERPGVADQRGEVGLVHLIAEGILVEDLTSATKPYCVNTQEHGLRPHAPKAPRGEQPVYTWEVDWAEAVWGAAQRRLSDRGVDLSVKKLSFMHVIAACLRRWCFRRDATSVCVLEYGPSVSVRAAREAHNTPPDLLLDRDAFLAVPNWDNVLQEAKPLPVFVQSLGAIVFRSGVSGASEDAPLTGRQALSVACLPTLLKDVTPSSLTFDEQMRQRKWSKMVDAWPEVHRAAAAVRAGDSSLRGRVERSVAVIKRWLHYNICMEDDEAYRRLILLFGQWLDNVAVPAPVILAVIGPQGSGKSTLSKLLSAMFGDSMVRAPTTDISEDMFAMAGPPAAVLVLDDQKEGKSAPQVRQKLKSISTNPIMVERRMRSEGAASGWLRRIVILADQVTSLVEEGRRAFVIGAPARQETKKYVLSSKQGDELHAAISADNLHGSIAFASYCIAEYNTAQGTGEARRVLKYMDAGTERALAYTSPGQAVRAWLRGVVRNWKLFPDEDWAYVADGLKLVSQELSHDILCWCNVVPSMRTERCEECKAAKRDTCETCQAAVPCASGKCAAALLPDNCPRVLSSQTLLAAFRLWSMRAGLGKAAAVTSPRGFVSMVAAEIGGCVRGVDGPVGDGNGEHAEHDFSAMRRKLKCLGSFQNVPLPHVGNDPNGGAQTAPAEGAEPRRQTESLYEQVSRADQFIGRTHSEYNQTRRARGPPTTVSGFGGLEGVAHGGWLFLRGGKEEWSAVLRVEVSDDEQDDGAGGDEADAGAGAAAPSSSAAAEAAAAAAAREASRRGKESESESEPDPPSSATAEDGGGSRKRAYLPVEEASDTPDQPSPRRHVARRTAVDMDVASVRLNLAQEYSDDPGDDYYNWAIHEAESQG